MVIWGLITNLQHSSNVGGESQVQNVNEYVLHIGMALLPETLDVDPGLVNAGSALLNSN
jgi:hypothetical protein